VKNVKIRTKLLLLVVLLMAGMGYYIYYSYSNVNEVKINGGLYKSIILQKDLIADILPPPEYIIESYLVVFQMSESTDSNERKQLASKMEELQQVFKERHQYWVDNLESGQAKQLITVDSYGHALDFYRVYNDQFLPAVQAGNRDGAKRLLNNELKAHYDEHRKAIDELVQLATVRTAEIEKEADQIVTTDIRNIILIGVIIALLISVLLMFTAGSILSGLRKISTVSHDLASGDGDLTIRLDSNSSDELGVTGRNFNGFITKLADIIRNLRQSSHRVVDETNQIKATMEQISSSIESLTQTATTNAASIEELSSTNILVSENTDHLLQQAEETVDLANRGGHAVQSTIDEMNRIKQVVGEGATNVLNLGAKAKQIDEIVVVINDIASQTNLLALNAAIEAARAGDAGRGFEVVAEEVRKLAEKSAESTKEIAAMIKEIQSETKAAIEKMGEVDNEVEKGVVVADQTGLLLGQIVSKMAELKMLIHSIATSTKEQAMATEDMARQTETITHNVEENSRAIDSSTRAITEIARVAQELNRIVDMFKI
jgi:methyl-accepting chemotaxis protein